MLKRVLFGLLFRKKGSEILRGDEVCGNLPEGADETFQIQKRRYQKGRGSIKSWEFRSLLPFLSVSFKLSTKGKE